MTVKELKVNTIDLGEIEAIVNECNRKEIKDIIKDNLWTIDYNESINCNPETFIFVEYNDGTTYARGFGYEDGTFKKTGIKAVEIDDGYEYYVFGKYEFNEYGVLTVA